MLNTTKNEIAAGYEIDMSHSIHAGPGSLVQVTNVGPGEVSLEWTGSPFPHMTAEHAIETGAALILTALKVEFGKTDEDGDHTFTMQAMDGVTRNSYLPPDANRTRHGDASLELSKELIRYLGVTKLATAHGTSELTKELREAHAFLSASDAAAIAAFITARSAA